MAQVTWVLANGARISDDVGNGDNLMDAAQLAGVTGIEGECGGCLSCATCHVVVDAAWNEQVQALSPLSDAEHTMLDITPVARQTGSRLSCQIKMDAQLEGLILYVP